MMIIAVVLLVLGVALLAVIRVVNVHAKEMRGMAHLLRSMARARQADPASRLGTHIEEALYLALTIIARPDSTYYPQAVDAYRHLELARAEMGLPPREAA